MIVDIDISRISLLVFCLQRLCILVIGSRMERKAPTFRRQQGRVEGAWTNDNPKTIMRPLTNSRSLPPPRAPTSQKDVRSVQKGLVLLPRFLDPETQLYLVSACSSAGRENFFVPDSNQGNTLHRLNMGTRGRLVGPLTSFPPRFRELCLNCLRAAQAADPSIPGMTPTTLLINLYQPHATFKWHQDSEEPSRARAGTGRPIISFSIGLTADFGVKHTYDSLSHDVIRLGSGDALVFGGPARMIVHSVLNVHGSLPAHLCGSMQQSRLNLTFRDVSDGYVVKSCLNIDFSHINDIINISHDDDTTTNNITIIIVLLLVLFCQFIATTIANIVYSDVMFTEDVIFSFHVFVADVHAARWYYFDFFFSILLSSSLFCLSFHHLLSSLSVSFVSVSTHDTSLITYKIDSLSYPVAI